MNDQKSTYSTIASYAACAFVQCSLRLTSTAIAVSLSTLRNTVRSSSCLTRSAFCSANSATCFVRVSTAAFWDLRFDLTSQRYVIIWCAVRKSLYYKGVNECRLLSADCHSPTTEVVAEGTPFHLQSAVVNSTLSNPSRLYRQWLHEVFVPPALH